MSPRGAPTRRLWIALLPLLCVGGATWWWLRGSVPVTPLPSGGVAALSGLEALARDFPPPAEGPLAWPGDHGAHAEQFVESWLFVGQLQDQAGQRLGFQLLFQRLALAPDAGERESGWAAREAWRARFTLQPEAAEARVEERLSRGALGLAGSSIESPGAWLEDWRFSLSPDGHGFELQAGTAGAGVVLELRAPDHAPLPVTTDGAGAYRGYWWPGLSVSGTLTGTGAGREVRGRAFLDHLWGRAQPVGRGQLALARMWLEGPDGDAWRCEQWRRRAGGGAPQTECMAHSSGSAAASAAGVELAPEPRGHQLIAGARLPLRWSMQVPGNPAPLRIAPLAAGAEDGVPGSWSGAVAGAMPGQWGWLELSNFVP